MKQRHQRNENRCSQISGNIYRNTPVSESLFIKVASLTSGNFIKKRLQHRYFSVNIAKFLSTPILKIICEQLLLTSLTNNICFLIIEKRPFNQARPSLIEVSLNFLLEVLIMHYRDFLLIFSFLRPCFTI